MQTHSITLHMKTNSLFFSTGNFNIFAILCAVVFMTVTIIVLIVVLSVNMKYSAVYHTNEEKRSGKRIWWWRSNMPFDISHIHSISFTKSHSNQFTDGLYEKNIDTLSINGNELNYKFPIDDIIYTIDEASLQPTSQPNLISFTTRNG